MSAEIDEKTARLVEMLNREKLGGVLLNSRHNFAWLTAGGDNGIDQSRENGVATILVTNAARRYVLANRIEMPRLLAEQVNEAYFEPIEFGWQQEKERPSLLTDLTATVKSGDLASDLASITGTRNIEGLIAGCRASLTTAEAERFRALGQDAGEAMMSVIANIRPGESELEIAEKMRAEFSRYGMSLVVSLVAAGDRISKFRHPLPSDKRWERTVLLVACAKRHGLIVSLSRMVCVGQVPEDLERKTEAAAFVHACLLNATKPGASGSTLYQIAAEAYASAGYAEEINNHHQGGAAGYRTREWVAHPSSTDIVVANQAFAWNPSITGTKVEETCLVGKDGIEIITASDAQPTIVTLIDGREYHSPDIISI